MIFSTKLAVPFLSFCSDNDVDPQDHGLVLLTGRKEGRQVGRQTGRQEDRHSGRQTNRKGGTQTDRKTDRQSVRDGHNHPAVNTLD